MTKPKWMQIVEETLSDQETVETLRRFETVDETTKEFDELGREVSGILDSMCDEWCSLFDFDQEGLRESMRERVESQMRNYFWELAEKKGVATRINT